MPVERFERVRVEEEARTLVSYWERRGYRVEASVEEITGEDADAGKVTIVGYRLRTDMVSGWPKELFRKRANAERAK